MLSAAESWNSPAMAEMLSASSHSVVLSILWAGRYKISNNLISTSKFHRLRELAASLMWIDRDKVRGPLWERKIWVGSYPPPPSLELTHWVTPKTPGEELQECSSSGHCRVPLEVWYFWVEFLQVVSVRASSIHHLPSMRKTQYQWKRFITHLILYFKCFRLLIKISVTV